MIWMQHWKIKIVIKKDWTIEFLKEKRQKENEGFIWNKERILMNGHDLIDNLKGMATLNELLLMNELVMNDTFLQLIR